MALTIALVYVGAWVVTTLATFLLGWRLADGPATPLNLLCFSLLAGVVWPLLLIGVVELSSLAVYATATSWRHSLETPDAWAASPLDHVVVPLR